MDGWRSKLGLLIPAVNVVMETDFARWAPPGVTSHATRVGRSKLVSTLDSELDTLNNSYEAVSLLIPAQPDLLLFGCTSATVARGAGVDLEIGRELSRRAGGIPCITTATAMVLAMRALGMKRIAMATPYVHEIDEVEVRFLEGYGFEVVRAEGLGIVNSLEIPRVSPEQIYHYGRKVCVPEADGIFISCTNFRSGEVLDVLERDLGKPVVTSNQASLWAALRSLGLRDSIPGAGRLLWECCDPLPREVYV